MDEHSKYILITGATGSIGSRLMQRLVQSGSAVRVLVRNPAGARQLKIEAKVEVFQADLSQPESLRGCMENCSAVYHCAAKLAGSDWSSFQAVNVDGTKALLEEARRSKIQRFVHLSTIGVYGWSEGDNIEEDFPWPDPNHPYFRTKQDAERAVQAAARDVPVAIARVGDVFGPRQQAWTINFLQMIKRGILQPPTDRDSGILNPVYIDNLIDALQLMSTHPGALGQIFNVVDGTPMRFSDYIRRLAHMAGKRVFAVPGFALKGAARMLIGIDLLRAHEPAVRPGDVDYLLHKATISGEKIRSQLGWRPSVKEEDAFRRTEEWLRAEGYLSQ